MTKSLLTILLTTISGIVMLVSAANLRSLSSEYDKQIDRVMSMTKEYERMADDMRRLRERVSGLRVPKKPKEQ